MARQTAFTSQEWTTQCRWWLGEPVYPEAFSCPACGDINDVHGYHATTCAKWGDRVAKHTCLCKEAAHTGHRAFLHPRCERNVGPVGTTNRDADVLLRVWEGGKPLAMDFAGTHPQQPSNCTHAGMNPPGSWATEYARLHKSAGRARCAATGTPFAAMVVETFGTWSPEAFGILSKMAGFLARHTGIETHVAAKRLFSRMSCILQRCNVRSILARSCPHRPHDDDPLFAEDWPCPVADVVVEDPVELAQDGTAHPRTHTTMRENPGEERNWDEEGSYTLEEAGVNGETTDGGGGGETTTESDAIRTTRQFPGSGRPPQGPHRSTDGRKIDSTHGSAIGSDLSRTYGRTNGPC